MKLSPLWILNPWKGSQAWFVLFTSVFCEEEEMVDLQLLETHQSDLAAVEIMSSMHSSPVLWGARVPIQDSGAVMSMGQEFIGILFSLSLSPFSNNVSFFSWSSITYSSFPQLLFYYSIFSIPSLYHEVRQRQKNQESIIRDKSHPSWLPVQLSFHHPLLPSLGRSIREWPGRRQISVLRTWSLIESCWSLSGIPLCNGQHVLVRLFQCLWIVFFPSLK